MSEHTVTDYARLMHVAFVCSYLYMYVFVFVFVCGGGVLTQKIVPV